MAKQNTAEEKQNTDVAVMSATELAAIEDEITKSAAAISASLQTGQDKIVTANKQYKLPDGTILGPVMEAVILGFSSSHSYYENEGYNKDNIQEPICFSDAIGDQEAKPAASVEKPFSPTCKECEWNKFSTSTISDKGKRCKEEYRVMLIPEGRTEPVMLSIPPTGLKAFANTLSSLISAYKHPVKAIARFEFNPHVQYSQPVLMEARENPNFALHFSKASEAMANLPRK